MKQKAELVTARSHQSLIKDRRFIQNAHVASQLHEMETRYSFQQDPRQAELPATIANYSHKMGVM